MLARRGFAVVVLMLGASALRAQAPGSGADLLADIVGTWQSDTVGGRSALSVCDWSPQEHGVICEQTLTTPAGLRHALSVFLPDSTGRQFIYYGIYQPGQDAPATSLEITGHVWIYGGMSRSPDGMFYRTVNDFTAHNGSYVWRQESSHDGVQWTVGPEGRAVRKRPLVPQAPR